MGVRKPRSEKKRHEPGRIPTGVPGLDVILGGGLVESSLYLIEGMAGAGKTILASQICFNCVRAGGRALYLTLLAESHGKMLNNLRGLAFFDEAAVSKSFQLISIYPALASRDKKQLIEAVARSLREYRPTILVVDGFRAVREFLDSDIAFTELVHELNSLVTAFKCTTLLLAPITGNRPHAEHVLVDGMIELTRSEVDVRRSREVEVHKNRGGDHLQGRHLFRITDTGLYCFPRSEALYTANTPIPLEQSGRLAFGIPTLDAMLREGLVAGSVTTLLGAAGAGKTLLGLKFLDEGIRRGENALYFGFYESPDRLIAKARGVGIHLARAEKSKRLQVFWQPPLELIVDELLDKILRTVRERKVNRLFIDGIDGFRQCAFYSVRLDRFFSAMSNALRAEGVTTIVTQETPLFSADIASSGLELSAAVENIIVLRYVELGARLLRLISIIKTRESEHEASIRELQLTSTGIRVVESFQRVEQVMTGRARIVGPALIGDPSIGESPIAMRQGVPPKGRSR
jgi:circadian clock protein KaiC